MPTCRVKQAEGEVRRPTYMSQLRLCAPGHVASVSALRFVLASRFCWVGPTVLLGFSI